MKQYTAHYDLVYNWTFPGKKTTRQSRIKKLLARNRKEAESRIKKENNRKTSAWKSKAVNIVTHEGW